MMRLFKHTTALTHADDIGLFMHKHVGEKFCLAFDSVHVLPVSHDRLLSFR